MIVAEAGVLGACCLLWIWVLTSTFPSSSRRGVSSGASLCFTLGSVPSRWQRHCMLRCPICQRMSPMASVRSSFWSCRQSPACPCCPPLLCWHHNPWWSLVLMLLATDSPIPVQCTHEYHILAFLWRASSKSLVRNVILTFWNLFLYIIIHSFSLFQNQSQSLLSRASFGHLDQLW